MKTNGLFEKCVANIDPAHMAEVECNMAISDEFWKHWDECFPHDPDTPRTELPTILDAILWGMRKQRTIDIKKAVNWWESELDANDDESYREWEKEVIKEFRKAMEK